MWRGNTLGSRGATWVYLLHHWGLCVLLKPILVNRALIEKCPLSYGTS
jgi:hypothetical protein